IRSLLYRKLVGAIRSLHRGDDTLRPVEDRERLLITLDDVRPRFAVPEAPDAAPRLAIQILEVSLYLCILSSFLTIFQPAPYEGLAAIVGLACLLARARVDVKIMPMVFLLFVLQIGGVASLVPVLGDRDAQTF